MILDRVVGILAQAIPSKFEVFVLGNDGAVAAQG
jgi:hypothetical protein